MNTFLCRYIDGTLRGINDPGQQESRNNVIERVLYSCPELQNKSLTIRCSSELSPGHNLRSLPPVGNTVSIFSAPPAKWWYSRNFWFVPFFFLNRIEVSRFNHFINFLPFENNVKINTNTLQIKTMMTFWEVVILIYKFPSFRKQCKN